MDIGEINWTLARKRLRDRWLTVRSEPGELPLKIENHGSSVSTAGFVAAALASLLVAWLNSGAGIIDFSQTPWLEDVLTPLAIVVALVFAWRAVVPKLSKGSVEITRDEVRVSEPGLFGTSQWQEPLSSFVGVRWSKRAVKRSSDSSGVKDYLNVIDLAHPDDAKFVPLEKWITDGDEPRKTWEDFATLLQMPAIDARDGPVVVRAAEDVDKGLAELAREGKVSTEWHDRPPPPDISVTRIGDGPQAEELVLTMKEVALDPRLALLMVAALGLGGVGAISQGQFFIGLLCFGFGVLLYRLTRGNRPGTKLRLTRSGLVYSDDGGEQSRVEYASIERVKAGDGAVVAETDGGEKVIARNLSPEGIAYVRDLVESAIANA